MAGKTYKKIIQKNIVNKGGTFIVASEEEKLATYPDSKNLKINQSDLKLELIHFAKANENKPNIGLLISVASVWITVFTAEFHSIYLLPADTVRVVVVVLAIISTLALVHTVFISFCRFLVSFYFIRKLFNVDSWIHQNEVDPEKKAESIIKKCEIKL